MTDTADVVVIGAGIVGCSIAYHLTQKGVRDIVVVDRRSMIGSGTTAQAAGGLRKQFSCAVNVRMVKYSQGFYQELDAETDRSLDLHISGYLLLAASEAEKGMLLRNMQTQQEQGVSDVSFVDVESIRKIAPDIRTDDLVGAAFCPSDGYLMPEGAVQAIARRAKAEGVRFLLEEEVLEIPVEQGKVTGVRTSTRKLSSRAVVNAAGPHAAEVGRLVGVKIPITPLRRNLYLVGPAERVRGPYPMVIDFKHRFSFRHEPEGVLIGGGPPNESFNFRDHTEPDLEHFARATSDFIHRIPALEQAGLIRAWAGTDGYTRDGSGIVDRLDSPEGFYCATGFCGHGVMQAPATGKVTAELIVDGRASLDISGLGLKRFLPGGTLTTEGYVIAHLE